MEWSIYPQAESVLFVDTCMCMRLCRVLAHLFTFRAAGPLRPRVARTIVRSVMQNVARGFQDIPAEVKGQPFIFSLGTPPTRACVPAACMCMHAA